jgi:hypothetical protein
MNIVRLQFLIVLLLLFGCKNQEREPASLHFIESASFSLRDDVSEKALLKAFDEVQQKFMSLEKGCVGRQLAKDQKNEYLEKFTGKVRLWQTKHISTSIKILHALPICKC